MLTQTELRDALKNSKLNFKIDSGKVNLIWLTEVSGVNEPLLCAEVLFDDKLIPSSNVVCTGGLDVDMKIRAEKFTQTIAIIILLRSKKLKTEDGRMTPEGEFANDTEFYKRILLVYDDICSKY